jgi:hypothetical protein
MPSGLHRTYGAYHLHFITCLCYRWLAPARLFEKQRSESRSCDTCIAIR